MRAETKDIDIVIDSIEYKIVFSRRRTLGISVLADASVVVRVPYRTSQKAIKKLVEDKSGWIIKHRDFFRNNPKKVPLKTYLNGSTHLFRGIKMILSLQESRNPFVIFNGGTIEMGISNPASEGSVRNLLHKAFKSEAQKYLPIIFYNINEKLAGYALKPTGLVIRTMRSRWGSCTNKGKITLNSELIRLSDKYIEYVIIHEICHLRHHNHGPKYYELLSLLYPEWKTARKEMKNYNL
ncbi:MAG TPA: SprT family zinc-dependent metalloprotease [Bacteroidales bacterium]|nr:SprT family zinc-dependent metalloprotease [Bacteroidales bacterium]